MTATDDDRVELTRQILAELQREQDENPDVIYELRPVEDSRTLSRPLVFDGRDELFQGRDAWEQACLTGDLLSGQLATHFGIWQVRIFTDLRGDETRREESYIVSTCGGSQYWQDDDDLHQIGSAGFCWTCLHPDRDLDQERHGLIRHPVTPGEIDQPDYRCFVCGVEGGDPDRGHEDVDHTVIWGEEHQPRCEECELAYQTATPEGIGYVSHHPACPVVTS